MSLRLGYVTRVCIKLSIKPTCSKNYEEVIRSDLLLITILCYQHLSGPSSNLNYYKLGMYRISAPTSAEIRHFFQIWQKSGSGKNLTRAG